MAVRVALTLLAGLLAVSCSRSPSDDVGAHPPVPPASSARTGSPLDLRTAVAHGGATHALSDTSPAGSAPDALWARARETAVRAYLEDRARAGDQHAALVLALIGQAEGNGDPLERAASRAKTIHDVAEALPDDPLVAWLESQACKGMAAVCDASAAMARLQRLDPDNGYAWLDLLGEAVALQDGEAVDRLLELAGSARRFDSYIEATTRLLADTTRDAPVPALDADTRASIGEAWGLGRPPTDTELGLMHAILTGSAASLGQVAFMTPLLEACGTPSDARRASNCRALMGGLAMSGQILLERQAGLRAMVRATAGSPDGAAWRERLRRNYWLVEMLSRQHLARTPGFLERQVYEGEIAALEHVLRMRGLSDPPPGWLPDDPNRRALVLTGREPAKS